MRKFKILDIHAPGFDVFQIPVFGGLEFTDGQIAATEAAMPLASEFGRCSPAIMRRPVFTAQQQSPAFGRVTPIVIFDATEFLFRRCGVFYAATNCTLKKTHANSP